MKNNRRSVRRHHRERILNRRIKILRFGSGIDIENMTHKIMNWHINCNCMGVGDYKKQELRREKRRWKSFESKATGIEI